MTTYTEAQIQARHQERVSALVDLYGSTLAIPNEIIKKLQERNKEDWVQFVAERDGKAKSEPDAPLMPVVTDEQIAEIEDPGVAYVTDDGLEIAASGCEPAPDLSSPHDANGDGEM